MYAKTLYMPETPQYAKDILKSFTKNKVPHFFKYAKDKEVHQVEELNNSTVNKLYNLIPNKVIQFKKIAGNFNYKILMNDLLPRKSNKIIDKYVELTRLKRFWLKANDDSKEYHFNYYSRTELLKLSDDPKYVVDVLIDHLYSKNSNNKNLLWNSLGDIIYTNIISNTQGTTVCNNCLDRFESEQNNEFYCEPCKFEVKKEKERLASLRYRQNKKNKTS